MHNNTTQPTGMQRSNQTGRDRYTQASDHTTDSTHVCSFFFRGTASVSEFFTFTPVFIVERKVRRCSPKEKQQRLVDVYLGLSKITTIEECKHHLNSTKFGKRSVLARATLTAQEVASLVIPCYLKLDDIPESLLTKELVIAVFRNYLSRSKNHLPDGWWDYNSLPNKLKTDDLEKEYLKQAILPNDVFRKKACDHLMAYPGGYNELVKQNIHCVRYVPAEVLDADEDMQTLCREAIKRNPRLINDMDEKALFAESLLKELIENKAFYLSDIPPRYITRQMIEFLKVKRKDSFMCSIGNLIPPHLFDYSLCQLAVDQSSSTYIPFHMLIKNPEFNEGIRDFNPLSYKATNFVKEHQSYLNRDVLEDILKKYPLTVQALDRENLGRYSHRLDASLQQGLELDGSQADMLTTEQCRIAIIHEPSFIQYISPSVLEQNPALVTLAATYGELVSIPESLRTLDVYCRALMVNAENVKHVPESVWQSLPQSLLLFVAPEYLPYEVRLQISKQDDFNLHEATGAKVSSVMSRDILLSLRTPKESIIQLAASRFLKYVLMNTPAFQLRNEGIGATMQKSISQHCENWGEKYKAKQMIVSSQGLCHTTEDTNEIRSSCDIQSCDVQSCVNYGGRALMMIGKDKCTRYKFLRSGEPLDKFFREAAVQEFARNNLSGVLKSEVPEPVGYSFIPVDRVSQKLKEGFSSVPEIIVVNGQHCYLCFEFTTLDEHYSTLAYQKTSDDSSQAEEGILKGCYDEGVWNSLGGVHTSTIKAYHQFGKQDRRELFLVHLFSAICEFPGTLEFWDSKAIQESDWGYTGLRDIGDMEFYPAITSYFQSAQGREQTLLPGFDQRAAFMNAFCENMVAAVLHYAKLHRDDEDYNYKSQASQEQFVRFLDKAISHYLTGLHGDTQRACDYFESEEVYREWLAGAVIEGIMWTARQSLERDCFARSLQQTGCYPEEVYPIKNLTSMRYPKNFTVDEEDQLGASSSKFGLTSLLFGLYQVAAASAVKLAYSKPIGEHVR